MDKGYQHPLCRDLKVTSAEHGWEDLVDRTVRSGPPPSRETAPEAPVRATEAQRNALLTIMSGQAGNAWFKLIASVVSTVHDPQFVPFEFEFDLAARKARCVVPGILETVSQPVLNEATGQAHSVQVCMPQGMEYKKCEIAHAAINKGAGKIAYDHPMSHSSLALVDQTHQGLRS